MPEKYTPSARAALMVLLEKQELPNPVLTKQYKITLGPVDRERLNKDGLLETSKAARTYVHRITDKGIEWILTDIVEGEAPTRSGPLARANAELLRHFVRYHRRHGTLVEVIRSGDRTLETLIREVYLDLSAGPQDWIRLARIRPRLDGAEKSEVDETLLKMIKTGTAHLAPDSNRKVLTEADHAAAVRVGGEDKHLLAIEES